MSSTERGCLAALVAIVLLIVFVAYKAAEENERLVVQCMDDGKPEYECRALLRREYRPPTVIVTN